MEPLEGAEEFVGEGHIEAGRVIANEVGWRPSIISESNSMTAASFCR